VSQLSDGEIPLNGQLLQVVVPLSRPTTACLPPAPNAATNTPPKALMRQHGGLFDSLVRLFTNMRFFVLRSSMLITLLKSIWAGFLMAVLLMLPFFGPFTVGLLLFPICLVSLPEVQQFCKSSEYVEFGFAWITIHSKAPFFFYWAWFSIVALALYKINDFRLTGKQSSS